MSDSKLSLSDYLENVKKFIQVTFNEAVWVKAEIRNLNIKAGHYYLELAEKAENTDRVIATCRSTIWKLTAQKIIPKFEAESGIQLSRDLNVLIKVKARFDPQYGFSVNIEEIDSSFTLGDLARRYQQIIEQLTFEGLIDRNKQLPEPFDIHNILVITPENAAGLGDFKRDADILEKTGVCHFIYHSAIFQGKTAASSIIQSLSNALKQWATNSQTPPDLIVIIRGGGSVNDLAYLNDYNLATLLCRRSVPIWVGIGHEKDCTVLDEVAHRSFDTPSKVIAGIRNVVVERSLEVTNFLHAIQLMSKDHITAYQSKNEQLIKTIQTLAQFQLSTSSMSLNQIKERTQYLSNQQIKYVSNQINTFLKETLLQNPKKVISKGYAIVRFDGKAIRSVQQLYSESHFSIEMQDGLIQAQAVEVKTYGQ